MTFLRTTVIKNDGKLLKDCKFIATYRTSLLQYNFWEKNSPIERATYIYL